MTETGPTEPAETPGYEEPHLPETEPQPEPGTEPADPDIEHIARPYVPPNEPEPGDDEPDPGTEEPADYDESQNEP